MGRPSFIKLGQVFVSNTGLECKVLKLTAKDARIKFLASGYKCWVNRGNLRKGEIKDHMQPSVNGIGYLGGTIWNHKEHKK